MLNNRIYILNGFCNPSKRDQTNKGEVIELLNTDTLQSKILTSNTADKSKATSARSPVAVHGAGSTVIDNVVYIVGGATMTRNHSSDNVNLSHRTLSQMFSVSVEF